MLKLTEILFSKAKGEVEKYLKEYYNRAGEIFTSASPYGQILTVLESIHQSVIGYIKLIVRTFNINGTDNKNIVRGLVRLAGHDPGRPISATGTIRIRLKAGIDWTDLIPGGTVTIVNRTKLINKRNNFQYYIDLNQDFTSFNVNGPQFQFVVPVTQGRVETQTYTGTGNQNQSFTVVVPNNVGIEQFKFTISVNGKIWPSRNHYYDMLPNEEACVTRTGISGGLDIYFGNGSFGAIPVLGAVIEVRYVVSNGGAGNIPAKVLNDFTFIDDLYDAYGSSIDFDRTFDTIIEQEIGFGANSESLEFTKAIVPFISRNFVLARPEQYVFHLRKLGIFSYVNAYVKDKDKDLSNDSYVYVTLIPDIRQYFLDGSNYFTVPYNTFILDSNEQNRIKQYIERQGIQVLGTSLVLIQPKISRYVINLFLRIYEDVDETSIRAEILSQLSDYFVDIQRTDRIPRSDLIRIIDSIEGVDSIDVRFISEKNEAYHRQYTRLIDRITTTSRGKNVDTSRIVLPGYNKNLTPGLDPVTGDAVFEADEVPLIRGGWSTRQNVKYDDTPKERGLGSVNFVITGRTKRGLMR